MAISLTEATRIIQEEANNLRNVFGSIDEMESEDGYDSWMANYKYTSSANITFLIKVSGGVLSVVKWRGSGNLYCLSFASFLSVVARGKTLMEASALTVSDVTSELGIAWPARFNAFTLAPLNALQNTISAYQRGIRP